ncbi:Protein O-mannosyltransferase 2 [Coemansia sp. RSA 2559]|nr:Protein O-mannosyltransferase 2 [Coemansia sp. RSA 2559]
MYLNGTYIHDVHPPLGKLLVALAEHLWVADRTFQFNAGAKYPPEVNHAWLRTQVAMWGVFMAPLAYATIRFIGKGQRTAVLAAWFVIFDNALCLMTRIVVLDGPLLCFTAMALAATVRWLRTYQTRWMAVAGLSLALATSVKWVGLFTVLLVGILTAIDIIYRVLLLVNTGLPATPRKVACCLLRLVAIRSWLLIVLPLCVYTAVFRVHFAMQTENGVGEQNMPIRFQANLRNNRYNRQPTNVAYNGSIAKLWPDGYNDGDGKLLAFRLNEQNNGNKRSLKDPQHVGYGKVLTGADWWAFKSVGDNGGPDRFVCDGCMARLVHDTTRMPMQLDHSHRRKESSADGDVYPVIISPESEDDSRWIVEIVSQEVESLDDGLLHPIGTVFRLRHFAKRCTLAIDSNSSSSKEGSTKTSVICTTSPAKHANKWRIEYHVHWLRGFDNNLQGKVRTSFIKNMWAQNRIMAAANAELTPPDPDRYDVLVSAPWTWPFLLHPMRMSMWDPPAIAQHSMVVYEIGNPLLWWSSAVLCVFVYPLRLAIACIHAKRGSPNSRSKDKDKGKSAAVLRAVQAECLRRRPWGWVLWLGWALHYLPFFLLQRVTYLHHYLPALYFALLLLAVEVGGIRRRRLFVPVLIATAAAFCCYSPCTYGWRQTAVTDLWYLRLLARWNIGGSYHD